MIIYLIAFALSYIFALLAENNYKKNKKNVYFIIFSIVAIVIPSALAGLRASGVGTDTKVYIDKVFVNTCKIKGISNFIKYTRNSRMEPLYLLINFIVSRFSHNIHVMYFVLQLIIMSFTYVACVKSSKKKEFSLTYLVFLLLYYNRSLNICRQTIAISIVLFAFSYAWEQKLVKYLIYIIIACCFHKSAAIALIIYWLVPLMSDAKKIENKNKYIFRTLIITISVLVLIFYRDILTFLIKDVELIGENYYKYAYAEKIRLQPMELELKIMLLPIFLVLSKYISREYKEGEFLAYFMIIDLILFCVGFYALDAQRLSFYFGVFNIYLIPAIGNCFKGKKSKVLINSIIIIFLITNWYLFYCRHNYHETYPYQSIFR